MKFTRFLALTVALAPAAAISGMYQSIESQCNGDKSCIKKKAEEETASRASSYFQYAYGKPGGESMFINDLCYAGGSAPINPSNYRYRDVSAIYSSSDCENYAKAIFTEWSAQWAKKIKEEQREEQRIAALRNSKTRMCYQGVCLQDPISKLSLPVAEHGGESKLDLRNNPKLLEKAKNLFQGISSSDIELLATRGYAEGETKNASQQTLDALKRIKTLCGKPAMFASVQAAANNGKKISIVYSPMTAADGISSYGVAFIGVPFPEIQSNQEMDLLIQKASETMNVPLKCGQLGAGQHCHNYAEDQEFNIESGYVKIMQSRRFSADYYFDLNKARAHPLCKSEVTF